MNVSFNASEAKAISYFIAENWQQFKSWAVPDVTDEECEAAGYLLEELKFVELTPRAIEQIVSFFIISAWDDFIESTELLDDDELDTLQHKINKWDK